LKPEESDANRLERRIQFFQEIAEESFINGIFPEDIILLRRSRIPLVVRGYFILNQCYKNWRIKDQHWTEVPKIAALQSIAIMTFEPFRPLHLDNVTTVAEAKCNEMYAVHCAAAILGVPINPEISVKRDFWLRLLDVLTDARCQTLEPFRIDINLQISRPDSDYHRVIHDIDRPVINSLISIFELLSDKFKPI